MSIKLSDSEERYRMLVESIPDVMWVADSAGKVVFISVNSTKVCGVTPEEVYKAGDGRLFSSIHPDDVEYIKKAFQALFESGTEFNIEHRVRRADGEWIWVHNRSMSVFEKDGVKYASGLVADITERKRMESAVSRGKREWEATFDAVQHPIFIHDNMFRIVRANIAYRKLTGLKFREFIGRPYYEVFPKMDGPFNVCINCLKMTGKKDDEEIMLPDVELPLPDSDKIYRNSFFPLWDEYEGYSYAVHIMEDITEKKLADDKIRQSEIRYRHLFDNLNDAVFVADVATGRIIETNRLGEAMLGRSKDEIIGMHQSELHPPGKSEEYRNKFAAHIEKGRLADYEGEVIRKDGCIVPVHISAEATEISGQRIILGLFTDITERRKADEKIKEEMEVIGRLLMIAEAMAASADINELMHHVVSCAHMLIRCNICVSYLWDKELSVFRASQTAGLDAAALPSFMAKVPDINNNMVWNAFQQHEAPFIIQKADLIFPWIADGGTAALLPLAGSAGCLGLIACIYSGNHEIKKRDIRVMRGISHQASVALEKARLVSDLDDLFIGTVKALSSAIDAKSKWTAGHSERVTAYAVVIAKLMGMDEAQLKDIELAGLLHDVGKIGTYESILDKPGKLTDEEFRIMRQHPVKGAEIVASIKKMEHIIPTIRHHHEYYDGRGYPDGLIKEAIPLYARILAVADAVDAMAADRPYRKGRGMDAIIEELKRCSGAQFDPDVVDAFIRTLGGRT